MTNEVAKVDEDSSEEDQEMMKEINQEIDGRIKISKEGFRNLKELRKVFRGR